MDLGEDATTATPSGRGAVTGQTILLIGSDHRATAAKHDARSDTMMLVRLSPRAKAVTVLSVPRDLKVTIPGKGTAKLNAAYAYGGVPLTVKTLHQVLGIGIDHVIDVDFAGFRALVNRARLRLHRRRPPLLQPQRRHRRHQLRVDRHPGRLPAPVRQRRARLRALPPRRQRPRPRRPPARLPAPGPRAVRRQGPARRPPRAAAPARREHPHRHPRLQGRWPRWSSSPSTPRASRSRRSRSRAAIGPSYVTATPAAIRTDRAPLPAPDRRDGVDADSRRPQRRKPARATGLVAAAPKPLGAARLLYPTRRLAGAVYDSTRAYR